MADDARTVEQFAAYQRMADYLNEALFDGKLPQVMLNFSRKTKSFGFFAPERWSRGTEKSHEISLNPEHLSARPAKATAGTLAHELAHLWQQQFGKPTRNGYHNREWADKMEEIGLYPSSTAAPGGKRTGQKVSHFIIEGGAFEQVFNDMPSDCILPWVCDPEPKKESKASGRFKYVCEGCGAKAWGKEGLSLRCGDCELALGSEPVGEAPPPKLTVVEKKEPKRRLAADKKAPSPLPGAVLVSGPGKLSGG